MRRRLALGAAAALLTAPLGAHDFWIEPSSFRPAVGSAVEMQLLVGSNFEGEPFPRVPKLITRFVLVSAASGAEREIPGRSGADPAGAIRIEEPGLQIAAYRSLDWPVTIEPAKFEQYLKEEGLEKILEMRRKRGDSEKPAREVFSRCAKALLQAGEPPSGNDRALGLRLELVAGKNPYGLGPGTELPVTLLLEGKPLAGALVQGLLSGEPGTKVSARTDRAGKAALRLPKTGFWLIKAVDMAPAPAGVDADWQSLWASLTFENGPRNPVGKAP